MLKFVTPHRRVDHVLDLSADWLKSRGRTGLLLDVDSTLKDHGAAEIPAAVVDWMQSLRADGLKLCLLSNGKPQRIAPLANGLGIPFVAKAFKPLPLGCHKALRLLELDANQTAIVGDQLFADVMAGRLAKLLTVLVRPTSPVEPWWTRLKRPIERVVLRCISVPQNVFSEEAKIDSQTVLARPIS
jgi:HAD superfamily phosphatase (TIGR01668 family)